MTNLEKIELILFVYTVSDAMLISTSKIVGKTVVVRVRRCVVGDFFFVLKSLMWGLLAARPRQSLQGLDNTASAYCSCFCY